MKYLLGIDLGTSILKVAVYSEEGEMLGNNSCETVMDRPYLGWAQQDPYDWLKRLKIIIKEILLKNKIKAENIEAIGICGQSHGVTPVGRDKKILGPCITWADKRTQKQVNWVLQHLGNEKIFNITGLDVDSIYTMCKIMWIKENQPAIYRETEKFLLPKDVLVFLLTGNYSTDYTDASVTNLYDRQNCCWSKELLSAVDLEEGKLARINKPWDLVGYVNSEMAEKIGLEKGTPVIAGGADWAVNFYGAGGVEPNVAINTSGTVGNLIITTSLVEWGISYTSVVPNLYNTYLAALTADGSLYKWARDEFCFLEKYIGKRLNLSAYKIMDDELLLIPSGSNGIFVYPYFQNSRNNLNGSIVGLSTTSKREEIIKAILEGIVFEYRRSIEKINKENNFNINRIIAIGGGARSCVWNQIKADILGVPVVTLNIQEIGTFGAAAMAGVAINVFNDIIQPIKEIVKYKEIFTPNFKAVNDYNEYYSQYKEIFNYMDEYKNTNLKPSND